jgi:quercetin dioxygenase-like cupin family protein
MTIGEENFILKKGCSIKFMADKNHTYKNLNEDKAVFQNIIFYR